MNEIMSEKKTAGSDLHSMADGQERQMIFDTHAHYNDEAFRDDLDDILAQLPGAGIGWAVNVSSDVESLQEVAALAKRYPFFYCSQGIHPSDCKDMTDETLEKIRRGCREYEKVVAIGEIGLDYYWPEPDREIQKKWFREQIRLAQEESLPIIIHSREAAQDTLDIVRQMDAGKNGGVIHCFSYSTEMAQEYIRLGFMIGIGGVVTFKNARRLKEVAVSIGLDSIVLETDCPYMAPVPHRGTRNSSLYLPLVAQEIAALREIPVQQVIEETRNNARRLYRL